MKGKGDRVTGSSGRSGGKGHPLPPPTLFGRPQGGRIDTGLYTYRVCGTSTGLIKLRHHGDERQEVETTVVEGRP